MGDTKPDKETENAMYIRLKPHLPFKKRVLYMDLDSNTADPVSSGSFFYKFHIRPRLRHIFAREGSSYVLYEISFFGSYKDFDNAMSELERKLFLIGGEEYKTAQDEIIKSFY